MSRGGLHAGVALIGLLILCAGCDRPPALATDAAERIAAEAAGAVTAGEYAVAAQRFEDLRDGGWGGGGAAYNAGIAWWRLGRTAAAVRAWRLAVADDPGDEEARAHLDLVAGLSGAPTGERHGRLLRACERLRAEGPAATLLAGWAILHLGLGLGPQARRRGLLLSAAAALMIGGGAMLLAGVTLRSVVDLAVVADPGLELRAAPVDGAPLIGLTEGTLVRVVAVRGEWAEARLPDGLRGWLPASGLLRLVDE